MKWFYCLVAVSLMCYGHAARATQSVCYGSTANGRLAQGVALPAQGENYVAYSALARWLGRTYVHSQVRDIFVASYQRLQQRHPDKVFKYAETGFEQGGRFYPHKTHQNGLSIDFMTPVVDKEGRSVHLPTHVLNKFGYNIEFDAKGEFEGYRIDYTALAAHIVALHQAAKAAGYDVWRVIFDPELQPELYRTPYGDYLRQHIQFSKRRSWVRHDEHYHVDFKIDCQPS